MVRVTVLKSLRTRAGAEDWLRIMKGQFPDAKIMETDTLKSFPDVAYTVDPTGFSSHIVIEEDLSPVIERVKEGDIGGIVAAFLDKGYARIDNYGFCFTEKWDETLREFMSKAFERGLDAFKSTSRVEVPEEFHAFMRAAEGILKSLGIPSVPESDVSADCEEPEGVSDEDVAAATETHNPPVPTDLSEKLDAEPISDEETKAENQEITKKSAVTETVFKSLPEARAWLNPDVSRYYVDTMTFAEKKQYGTRYSHIVREKTPSEPVGAFGNKRY